MPLLTVLTGSVVPFKQSPVAVPVSDPTYGVVGSVIQLSGQQSSDPSALPPRSGTDSTTVVFTNILNAPTGSFSSSDIDRVITLTGIDAGPYIIVAVNSTTQIEVVKEADGGTVVFTGGANSSWAIVDTLSYIWSFVSVPIGSGVELEDFRQLETDGSLVSFSPDIVGEYIIGLSVSNGVFESPVVTTQVSIRAILVPHARGIVPDGKFIWSYIRDVWQGVDGKELFETFWSALIQIIGGELLKLYQNDFNKSIRDIQDLYQRRWLSYDPKLDLVDDDCTFYIGNSAVGTNATTSNLGLVGKGILISASEILLVEGSLLPNVSGEILTITFDTGAPSNIHDYLLAGTNSTKTGYKFASPTAQYPAPDPTPDRIASSLPFVFSFQSTTWSLLGAGSYDYAEAFSQSPSPIDELTRIFDNGGAGIVSNLQVGDYIHYPGGPNAGVYKIISHSGTFVVVDHAPPGASDNSVGAVTANVYRPVGFTVAQPDQVTSTTIAIPLDPANDISQLAPGRVIVVGGQAYTIQRIQVSINQIVPLIIITASGGTVLTGLNGLNWRVADTLISKSQNFEALGVSPGDLFVIDVTNLNSQVVSQVQAQVVGVTGFNLSFVLTDEAITAGVIPPVPNHTYLSLSKDFGIMNVTENVDGSLTFSGAALAVQNVLNSGNFKKQYWNTPLTNESTFTILGGGFQLNPRYIIRNHTVPVDSTLKSIPVLQDWIVQPQVSQHDGQIFQVKNGVEYPIPNLPFSLVENSDYLVDNEVAFQGTMTFETGTNILSVENGKFLSRGLRPGDSFIITSPATLAATYFISAVADEQNLVLSRPIPTYILSSIVTANVEILRSRTGHFIRFVPGGFTAAKPAPDRLWAEVSFFDNFDTVESNFGILVGLTRADLDAVSSSINYRQAVAGLMFAFVSGPTISKVRLGAQILLGLPFAESTGIIRSIENDYRLDVNGNPILGRLLIEDTDSTNTPLGTLRVYTFPIDPASDLAGLETNPDTGKTYAVGDSVALFAALSKGVEIDDYITNPETTGFSDIAQIQQFHSVRLRANDTIFSLLELGLVSSFLKRITPSYVAIVIASDAEVEDNVSVLDSVSLGVGNNTNPILDNASLGIPAALVYDSVTQSGYPQIRLDDGVFSVRLSGSGLTTTYNSGSPSHTATFPAGGFITPFYGEGPVTRPGDQLYIVSGPNTGTYAVSSITDDNNIVVSGLPASGFQTATQSFAILRPITGIVRSGSANVVSGNSVITVEAGLQADGIMPGDFISLTGSVGQNFGTTIVQVGGPNGPLAAGFLRLENAPTFTKLVTGYLIVRKHFMASPFTEQPVALVSDGTNYINGSSFLYNVAENGDELQVQQADLLRLSIYDIKNLKIVPVLPAGAYNVLLCPKGRPGTPVGFDHIEKFDPFDVVDMSLNSIENSDGAACTSGSNVVVLSTGASMSETVFDPDTHGVKPGDRLILTNGGNSTVDVGYGPGIYPITQINPGASPRVGLGVNLTSNNPSAWKILRRR